jgi:hypothetical protein
MVILCNLVKEQKHLDEKLTKILKKRNLDKKLIDKKSIYELEDEMKIGHYKTSISESERQGYILLTTFSKEKLHDDMKILFE